MEGGMVYRLVRIEGEEGEPTRPLPSVSVEILLGYVEFRCLPLGLRGWLQTWVTGYCPGQ